MKDAIRNFENLEVINKLITNTKINIRSQDACIDVAWLRFSTPKKRRTKNVSRAGVHKHSFHEAHFCLSGSCCYQVKEKLYTIGEGDVIFLKANAYHCLLNKSDDFSKIALGFGFVARENDMSAGLDAIFSQEAVMVSSETARISRLFYAILEEFRDQKIGYMAAVNALLMQVVVEFARLYRGGSARQTDYGRRIDQRISEINRFIEDHMETMISCQDIADSLHMSTRQLNRIIKSEFDSPLSEYVDRAKCERAKNMLLYSDAPVSKIAFSLGYASEFSFSRFFKRVEGMPPSQFRQSRFSDCTKAMWNDD